MSDTSFQRWQAVTREQMGYAINTVLALAVATLGFILDKLLEIKTPSYDKCLMITGCFLLLLSIVSAIWLIVNRLVDFRLTARIARKRETKKTDGIDVDRKESQRLGKVTWRLFCFFMLSFLFGEIFTIVGMGLHIL